MKSNTEKLTTTQAIVKYLVNQYIEIGTQNLRVLGGGFGIFGHGNVTCLGEALYNARAELPLWRGQNEQSMALAAIGYAKYYLRKRFMFATSSAGPGTTNLLTASAVAHANRLPLLMLSGDTFITRLPDPVLQQVEHYNNPTISVNDAFRSVTRYWDKITHPAQVLHALPNAIHTMLDPADCGPAFIALPQDVQGYTYDFPTTFFQPQRHYIRRQTADLREIKLAAETIKNAKQPVIIAGGGVQYSEASQALANFAHKFKIPVVETIAGRANMLHHDDYNCGSLGTTGSDSANDIVAEADIVLAVGTRLQDFTTGSWTVFAKHAKIVHINVARFDATKRNSIAVVGDAKLVLTDLCQALAGYQTTSLWQTTCAQRKKKWDEYITVNTTPNNKYVSYAQVVQAVNETCSTKDRIVTAAGGLPAEVCANWRTKSIGSVDIEFGYSCMGYEIAGAWGAKMAQSEYEADADTFVFVGDGSYLMMNSDIYSSVLTAKKLIIIVCNNGGFAVINKLQNNAGGESYNNLITDCNIQTKPFMIDFVGHAQSMGANAEAVSTIAAMKDAIIRAKKATKTTVIAINCDPYEGWTKQGHAWWELGMPQSSDSAKVNQAREELEQSRSKQQSYFGREPEKN